MIKQMVKKCIVGNIYLYDLFMKIIGWKQEQHIKKIVDEMRDIDSIQDYPFFCKKIQPYLEAKQYLVHSIYGSESFHYGHLNELYIYAGINKKPSGKLFPAMEHAAAYQIVRHRSTEDVHRNLNFIYQSKYMKKYIHDIEPMKPVFCIGCYLHYVRPYYDKIQTVELKKKLGKVLLIIASHNLETSDDKDGDINLVDFSMNYAKENRFDTVMVSAYFSDINLAMYKEFQKRGAMIVSAGFREDPNFIRRLKSIFELSDLVMTNAIGSPVGFSKYMGKPYLLKQAQADMLNQEILLSTEISLENQYMNYDKLRVVSRTLKHSEIEAKVAEELYNYYTGGNDLIRTPEEIRAIIEIAEEMLHNGWGISKRMPCVVNNLLIKYKNGKNKNDIKYRLLKESVTNN